MPSTPALRSIAAAALLGCTLAAQAAPSSGASLYNLQMTIVDLDPSDGIAPSVHLGYGGLYGESSVFADAGDGVDSALGRIPSSYSVDAGDYARVLNTSGTIAGTTLQAVSTATIHSGPANPASLAALFGQFTIGPGTAIFVSADARLVTYGASYDEARQTGASLAFSSGSTSGFTFQNQQALNGTLDVGPSYSQHLVTYLANPGDTPLTAGFEAQAYAYGIGYGLTVPEPTPAPLLLAGLAALGLVSRRRR